MGRREASWEGDRRNPPCGGGGGEAPSRLPGLFSPKGVFSPERKPCIPGEISVSHSGIYGTEGGKRPGRKQGLEEEATVPRWLQSPCVGNTYIGCEWQDKEARM